ncbi:nitroreductase/quinone reductase family protein [Tsukamurella spumae]|uniref:Nitroreductase family deazaflavin-dependent oxidoreductase n=1 Tax=Tsukamurella spumae TaxID=44753 RepID=A0A846X3R5_9ACTN|nr:nitroreductase/quinone reductase family protein [Tsukamurella spumae]NKY19186.1 nitroreductase family deazaflavin-dependent oxidoreductase [Tsukamurella spumae]
MADLRSLPREQELHFNNRNIAEFRDNGGRVGGAFDGFPLLLLTSVGAKSGVERTSPMAAFTVDGHTYVVGSAAGRDADPAWVHNIRKTPAVTVELGSTSYRATAVELERAERDRIFAVVSAQAPGFAEYQRLTERVIPVFEIVPSTTEGN